MREFFLTILNKMEVLTGIRQLERLQDKPAHLNELLEECAKASKAFPIKEEIMKSVLMDAVSTDPDFIGLNVKWVRKILNEYCKVQGVTSAKEEEPTDLVKAYSESVAFWENRTDIDEDGIYLDRARENLERVKNGQEPINDSLTNESIHVLQEAYKKQVAGSFVESVVGESKSSGERLRETLYGNLPGKP